MKIMNFFSFLLLIFSILSLGEARKKKREIRLKLVLKTGGKLLIFEDYPTYVWQELKKLVKVYPIQNKVLCLKNIIIDWKKHTGVTNIS